MPCAVLYDGQWYVCHLVLATKYSNGKDEAHWSDTPIWSEARTTAYVCTFDQADQVIELEEDI